MVFKITTLSSVYFVSHEPYTCWMFQQSIYSSGKNCFYRMQDQISSKMSQVAIDFDWYRSRGICGCNYGSMLKVVDCHKVHSGVVDIIEHFTSICAIWKEKSMELTLLEIVDRFNFDTFSVQISLVVMVILQKAHYRAPSSAI